MTDQEKTDLLEKKLIEEREEWNNNITELVKSSKRIEELSQSQVFMLSYRQILVDKLTDMKNTIGRKISRNYSYIANRTQYYKTSHSIKLQDRDIKEFINADMSESLSQLDMLKNQIDYYRSTIDTLDKLGFAIKNRILIEQHNL
tara:strand:+ start:2047 stop:2481 length:435 start_codon:yes stop_codon:yes gene_type:complete